MSVLTTITSAIVRAALGAATNKWSLLVKHVNVNQWSRYKPVRGNWPAGTTGKYGLQLSDWSYLKPRGGGSNSEPLRAGDFRGYEHDKDIAGPVIYVESGDVSLLSSYIPSLIAQNGSWTFKKNSAHESVRIIPSDLGINSYYWGVKLTIGATSYYKTGALVSEVSGQQVAIEIRLTSLVTKLMADFPAGGVGTYTWQLFVSSTQATSWTTSAPSNIINLPSGTYGSKAVVTTGSFVVADWIIASQDGTTKVTSLTWAYNSTSNQIIYLYKSTGSENAGVHAGCLSGGYIGAHWGWTAWMGAVDVTADFDSWGDGVEVRLFPIAVNNAAEINVTGEFGLDNGGGTIGDQVAISLVHQNGLPPEGFITSTEYTLAAETITAGLTIGSTSVSITFETVPNTVHATIPITVTRRSDSHQLCSTSIHKESGFAGTGALTLDHALVAGDIIDIVIGNVV